MKTVDHSYEHALIMHDNVHIHVIMNIIDYRDPYPGTYWSALHVGMWVGIKSFGIKLSRSDVEKNEHLENTKKEC